MSDQEKQSGGSAQVGAIVMVETTSSRHSKPYRPTELHEETDLHHKRPKAPGVPSVAEDLKNAAENSTLNDRTKIVVPKECAHAISTDKHKHSIAKKLSYSNKKREPSPESITLASLESDNTKPMLPDVQSDVNSKENASAKKASKHDDDDSITDEVIELRVPEVAKKHSEWSDDEEAGGLPRSDSRSSRVTRAVRQLFCCGVTYDAPSEDNVSTHRGYPI